MYVCACVCESNSEIIEQAIKWRKMRKCQLHLD